MALQGIDVSGWQPKSITSMVDYDFVFVKATEGVSFVNKSCDAQYQGAKNRGKLRGFYHFASTGLPEAEAKHFYTHTQGYIGDGIPVLDFESKAVSRWGDEGARRFLDTFTELSGVKPMIYVSSSVAKTLKQVAQGDYGLWVASWGSNKRGGYRQPHSVSASPFEVVAVHQYTSRGRLPGYSGDLDLNIAYMSAEGWSKYVSPGSSSVTEATPQLKSVQEIAQEVWSGLWGNGDERRKRLTEAGYDYATVQEAVNSTSPARKVYTIQPGDTLSELATQWGCSVKELQELNGIKNADVIYAGQQLSIP